MLPSVEPSDTAFHVRLRCARAGKICGLPVLRAGMLVREPIHGMQGLLEQQGFKPLTEPLTYPCAGGL